jgi:hypothetical protein
VSVVDSENLTATSHAIQNTNSTQSEQTHETTPLTSTLHKEIQKRLHVQLLEVRTLIINKKKLTFQERERERMSESESESESENENERN